MSIFPNIFLFLLLNGILTCSNSENSNSVIIDDVSTSENDVTESEDIDVHEDIADTHEEDIDAHEEDVNFTSYICQNYATPDKRADLPDGLDEISGIALSEQPNILWMHNDSGDIANIYAVQIETGELLTTILLEDVSAHDWEDMTAGPCHFGDSTSESHCLYVADFGDNNHIRGDSAPVARIHRIPEPDPNQPDRVIDAFDTMLFQYDDGIAHNAEALVIAQNEMVFVLTKHDNGTFHLFGATFTPTEEEPITLTLFGTFDISSLAARGNARVTAADFDIENNRLLIRGYTGILEFELPAENSLTEFDDSEPRRVPNGIEIQGEAIVYGDGGYYHVAEGNNPPIYFIGCEE